VFCFIDQMPKGLRETLYVKDDDWRYSLMMGNFVTLTNVSEEEFERILRRRASPLYVSVHTTDSALRCRMMNNRFAGDLMNRLTRLKDAGIRFHCQIVVCPGYNDGEVLLQTLRELKGLAPAAMSAALVPVGLTKWREGLAELRPFDRAGALRLLEDIAPFQEECLRELGSTFAFPSDEFFCLADRPIPPEDWYEGYPQIENGVGLLRLLESQMEEAQELEEEMAEGAHNGETAHAQDAPAQGQPPSRTLLIATGVSAAPHLERLTLRFAPPGVTVKVRAVINHFFGETVTVAGLLTGGDLLEQLPRQLLEKTGADTLLIASCMLRHEGDRFLDDMTLEEFTRRFPLPVKVVGPGGQDLYDALRGR
jgi:putative radical SAM enzyme (TIGR03279 family)